MRTSVCKQNEGCMLLMAIGLGFRISKSQKGFWVLASGFWKQDVGMYIQNECCALLMAIGLKFRIQGLEFRNQNVCMHIQNECCMLLITIGLGFRVQGSALGIGNQDVGMYTQNECACCSLLQAQGLNSMVRVREAGCRNVVLQGAAVCCGVLVRVWKAGCRNVYIQSINFYIQSMLRIARCQIGLGFRSAIGLGFRVQGLGVWCWYIQLWTNNFGPRNFGSRQEVQF